MGHNHSGHSHNHSVGDTNAAFKIAVALNIGIVAFEAAFGFLSNSIALIADSGHNLTDVLGLVLAWGANVLAKRLPTQTRTYGYRRTTILAALMNAVILLVATGAILWEASIRLLHPSAVEGGTVAWVAGLAILLNGACALLFARGQRSDLNVKGAFLHMLSDAAVSAGVLIAGLLIQWTGLLWLDPISSILISIVVTVGTWGVLRDSFNLAADAVPSGVDLPGITGYLKALPAVYEVHDLHIWGMSTTESILTVHLVVEELPRTLVADISQHLHDRFGIEHATIQIEFTDSPSCKLAPDHIV